MRTSPGSYRLAGARRHSPPQARTMWQRYATFLRTPPEMSVTWHDPETGTRAWLVLNSSRGGTRMRPGMGPCEVAG